MKKTNWRNKRVLILAAAIVMFSSAGIRLINAAIYNYHHIGLFIRKDFPQYTSVLEMQNAYAEGVPMDEMDLGQVCRAATGMDGWGVSGMADLLQISAPCTISYFAKPGGDVLFQIQAGTDIWVDLDNPLLAVPPIGLSSFPTYLPGWRYAAPFPTEDGAEQESCAYVPLDALLRVAEAAFVQSGYDLSRDPGPMRNAGAREVAVVRILMPDWQMYSSGYYVSPDIYHEPWDGWTVGLLAAGGVLLAADGALVLRGRKRR